MMSILYLLLPLAFLLAFGFLAAFIQMSRKGQFDDLETPAHRMLIEDSSSNAISTHGDPQS